MSKRGQLVCQHLENISGSALEKYQRIIREYVKGRQGVYALYRREKLYYVGLASDLRIRLKQHLKDRHAGAWDSFSVYLTIGHKHLKEMETLMVRVGRPMGNRTLGNFFRSENMLNRFKKDYFAFQRGEFERMIGQSPPSVPRRPITPGDPKPGSPASRYVDRSYPLRARYKGKVVPARLRKDGQIRCRGRLFRSPSGAASYICKHPVDGWHFWQYERASGDWVALDDLRR